MKLGVRRPEFFRRVLGKQAAKPHRKLTQHSELLRPRLQSIGDSRLAARHLSPWLHAKCRCGERRTRTVARAAPMPARARTGHDGRHRCRIRSIEKSAGSAYSLTERKFCRFARRGGAGCQIGVGEISAGARWNHLTRKMAALERDHLAIPPGLLPADRRRESQRGPRINLQEMAPRASSRKWLRHLRRNVRVFRVLHGPLYISRTTPRLRTGAVIAGFFIAVLHGPPQPWRRVLGFRRSGS